MVIRLLVFLSSTSHCLLVSNVARTRDKYGENSSVHERPIRSASWSHLRYSALTLLLQESAPLSSIPQEQKESGDKKL